MCAASLRLPSRGSGPPSSRRGAKVCSAIASSKAVSISVSICASARALTFAARKPLCWPPSKASAGSPFPGPPYPPERGLWTQPTLINNVETFANIPTIIENGGEWFASIGSPTSPGTKVFALAGQDCARRAGRGSHRNAAADHHLRSRRRRPGRLRIQGGANRRSCGRLHSGHSSRSPDGLRFAAKHRSDDGLRRTDRDGYFFLHGGYRALLHGILQGRILRQVHSLPRGHGADARHPGAHDARRRSGGRLRHARRTVRASEGRRASADSAWPRPTPCSARLRHFRSEYEAHVREHRCPAGHCRHVASPRCPRSGDRP